MLDNWDTRPYGQRVGDATSQWFNTVFTRKGAPDESLSGRSYRNTVLAQRLGRPVKRRWKVVRFLAEVLFWYRDRGNHTEFAFIEDALRANARWQASKAWIAVDEAE